MVVCLFGDSTEVVLLLIMEMIFFADKLNKKPNSIGIFIFRTQFDIWLLLLAVTCAMVYLLLELRF